MMRAWITICCAAVLAAACGPRTLKEVQRVKAGKFDIVLLSSRDAIAHGQDSFVIEFRASDNSLVDVGDVIATSRMPMPGAPMLGGLDVKKTSAPGRYDVDAKFDMAGTWRTTIQWSGPAGPGSVTFSGNVQ